MNSLIIKYAIGLLVIVGPYLSTWYYRSNYKKEEAALELKTQEVTKLQDAQVKLASRLDLNISKVAVLTGVVNTCNAATAALAEATAVAINARERADKAAQPKIQQRQDSITAIKEIIKETSDETKQCDQIKQLLDSNYATGSLRNSTKTK